MDIAFERVSTWRYWTDHQVEEKRGKRRGRERERGVKMSIWGRLSASVLQVVVVVEVVFWHGDLPFGVVDVERAWRIGKGHPPAFARLFFFRWQVQILRRPSVRWQCSQTESRLSLARVSPRSKLYRYASLSHAFGVMRVSEAAQEQVVRVGSVRQKSKPVD